MMENTTMKKIFLVLFFLIAAAGFYACAGTASMVRTHPMEVTGMPVCSDCHADWRTALNHTNGFSSRHKFLAAQRVQACGVCHEQSFCSDCHAHKEDLKPSDKYKDSPERFLPHRGDYLNQHKIDGRINPASCARCHGRSNNERCKTCHR